MALLNSGVRWKHEEWQTLKFIDFFFSCWLKDILKFGQVILKTWFSCSFISPSVPHDFGRKYERQEHSTLLFFPAVLLHLLILLHKHRGPAPFLRNVFFSLFSRSNNFYQPLLKFAVTFPASSHSSGKAISWQLSKTLYVYLRNWMFHFQNFYLFFFMFFFLWKHFLFKLIMSIVFLASWAVTIAALKPLPPNSHIRKLSGSVSPWFSLNNR